jgi:Flp pilus assembly protein TadD
MFSTRFQSVQLRLVNDLNPNCHTGKMARLAAIVVFLAAGALNCLAQPTNPPAASPIQIIELQGTVEILPSGATAWLPAHTNQVLNPFDRIHAAANSRVALRWSDQSILPFGASTELEILPPDSANALAGLHLIRGVISFFHRDQPGRIRIITRGAVAGVEGTEFVLAVNDTDATTLSVVDGQVRFGNAQATLLLTNGEAASVEVGQAPVRTTGFIANNLLQWCFYYPAVIDPDELPLAPDEQTNLAASLAAYRAGDLLAALAQFPAGQPGSDGEKIYYAALLLSVGEVAQTETTLAALPKNSDRTERLANALRELIAAVKRQPNPATAAPQLASEFLAGSYYEQSRALRDTSLQNALTFAQRATAISPRFGFAWERVAELEFSFGRTKAALVDLDKSVALAPRNAQALALKGFILSAQNEPRLARDWFDRALAADSALGNAWLGRGIVRIRLGDELGGREDMLVAAALEPQRAELRSYLAKSYLATGDDAHAAKELALAKKLDPNDPTAWLYSALMNQQNNQINTAIRDLEKSEALNDNRSVYRSQLLLDQDQAVRSANLASIYRDAGMTDVSQREAERAVNYDYANYSAHNFLASSYDQLSQPGQNNLRYETPGYSEFLIANLLAPASAGTLSPLFNQQTFIPYERNHVGVVSSTEYLSRDAWTQSGLQYGTFDNFSYGLQGYYHSDPGQHVNNDEEDKHVSLALKVALTPQDNLYASVDEVRRESGDLNQYYDPYTMGSGNARITENQEPDLTLGYHHQWGPGSHTLFVVSRIQDDQTLNAIVPLVIVYRSAYLTSNPYEVNGVYGGLGVADNYHNTQTLYTTEAQQILEQGDHTTIVGTRYQNGSFHTTSVEHNPPIGEFWPDNSPIIADQNQDASLNRISVYGYHLWQITDPLQLVGGLSYDWIYYPENILSPPVSTQQTSTSQLSPKVGLIWTPYQDTTVRFAYTRSMGGQNLDQSVRIEPTQVAGFQQTFRTIIGEPSVAQNGASKDQTYDVSLEQKFSTGTYLGLTGEILKSQISQTIGVWDYLTDINTYANTTGLGENLNYQEESLQFTANQLLGRDWALGAQYRLSYSKLEDSYPGIPAVPELSNPNFPFYPRRTLKATLNQVNLYAIYNLPCGFFSEANANWYGQSNSGYVQPEPGDSFWQFDAFVGYRFWKRAAQVSVGVLNLANQNYLLNPLNAYSEMPRERTLAVRFQFNF